MMSYYAVKKKINAKNTLVFYDDINGERTIGSFKTNEEQEKIAKHINELHDELNTYKDTVQSLTTEVQKWYRRLRTVLIGITIFICIMIIFTTGLSNFISGLL